MSGSGLVRPHHTDMMKVYRRNGRRCGCVVVGVAGYIVHPTYGLGALQTRYGKMGFLYQAQGSKWQITFSCPMT